MTTPAKPTAEGSLAKTPLTHLLVYMLDQGLTGSTVLENPGGPPHIVYFLGGRPAKMRLGKAVEPLDRVLLDLGLLDQATLQASLLTISKSGALHGRHLVDTGLLTEAKLIDALRAQLVRKLEHLFMLPPDTHYAYFDGVNLAASYGGPELTPHEGLSVVMAGVRLQAVPLIEDALSRLGDRALVLHEWADMRMFGFQRGETAVVDLIRSARPSIGQLLASQVADATTIKRTVYALVITRHLDIGAGKPPVGVPRRTPSAPDLSAPRTPTPRSTPRPTVEPTPTPPPSVPAAAAAATPEGQRTLLDKRRAELREKLDGIESSTYYARLDLDPTADKAQVESAYFALAKRFHPDRMSAELAELRPDAAKLFGHISQAYQALIDTERRRQYDESLQSGAGAHDDAAQIARVVDAALEFQKAEALLKKSDFAGAEVLAARAVTADPGQPEYVTLLAWIQAQRRGDPPVVTGQQTSPHFDDLIALLDGVLAKEARYERALFYRGMLLKRAGYVDRAILDFRLATQINPRNIDAAREVRLFDMRQQHAKAPSPPPARPSLFGKLFKK
jgi:tetratricopeptide (TPR) repeat protein